MSAAATAEEPVAAEEAQECVVEARDVFVPGAVASEAFVAGVEQIDVAH